MAKRQKQRIEPLRDCVAVCGATSTSLTASPPIRLPASCLTLPAIEADVPKSCDLSNKSSVFILKAMELAGLMKQEYVDSADSPDSCVSIAVANEFPRCSLISVGYAQCMADSDFEHSLTDGNDDWADYGGLTLASTDAECYLITPVITEFDKAWPGFLETAVHHIYDALSFANICCPSSLRDIARQWYWGGFNSPEEAIKSGEIDSEHFYTKKVDEETFPQKWVLPKSRFNLSKPPSFGRKRVRGHRLAETVEMLQELKAMKPKGCFYDNNMVCRMFEEHTETASPFWLRMKEDDASIHIMDDLSQVAQQCAAPLDVFWTYRFSTESVNECADAWKRAVQMSKIVQLGSEILSRLFEREDRHRSY